ncbi:MAG TPA: alpha/beta hydrolase [Candidatus Sulfotelmatobacter sp.]|nr:alpha/beta hydrolase [Candidatus Sulfotelmatobacter sp.]
MAIAWQPGGGRPHLGRLAARTLGDAGTPVVLLHGLAGSSRLWGSSYDVLAQRHRLIAVDLLGHGASPHPPQGYSLRHHADALAALLDELGVHDEAVLMAHSFGCLVAMRFALDHPERVAGIVAIAPPLYRSPADARAFTLASFSWMERTLCMPTPFSRLLCRTFCAKRPHLAEAFARRWRPQVPQELLRDALAHTWTSYSESMAELLRAAARPEWVARLDVPVAFVVGSRDLLPDMSVLRELEASSHHASLHLVEGAGHLLPLTHPLECLRVVERLSPRRAAVSAAGTAV